MEEERKILLDGILEEAYKMIEKKTWPVTEDELVEHTRIGSSFDFGFLCGYLHCKEQMMKDAVEATVTDIRTYKHENEVDFTIMLDKGIIPYETEEELKLTIIKED